MPNENHIALYRKYRPQTFDEVVGQEHVIDVLSNAIAKNNIAHAYLFSGGRGTGKTSVARIFAQAVGTGSKDLYEMDAASNRKIDDFRELNSSVHTLPFESKYKVYIIDEVHMLTKDAFNAFLKTLEEPPKHVIFILATTELEKLPDTIVSRCQTYIFKQPTRTVLANTIDSIAKREGRTLETNAAELIAVLGDGSFRDALGVLQKVLSFSKEKVIVRTEVEKVTDAPRGELIHTLVQALADGSKEKALTAIQESVDQNIDFLIFEKLLLDRVRSILLLKNAPILKEQIQKQYSENDFAFIEGLASMTETHINAHVLSLLLQAYVDTHHSYIPQLPLELAIINSFSK